MSNSNIFKFSIFKTFLCSMFWKGHKKALYWFDIGFNNVSWQFIFVFSCGVRPKLIYDFQIANVDLSYLRLTNTVFVFIFVLTMFR